MLRILVMEGKSILMLMVIKRRLILISLLNSWCFSRRVVVAFPFSMFINDMKDVSCSNYDVGVYLFDWLLTILLFAVAWN